MQFVAEPRSFTQFDAAGALRVDTVTDLETFLGLEADWNNLVAETGIDHPFLTHEWMRTWWQSFGDGKRLHLLVVTDGPDVVAVAPLMLSVGSMYGVRVRCLQLFHNDHAPRLDFIVRRGRRDAYGAIWTHLRNEKTRWDVLELGQLPAGSPTLEELPRLAAADGFLTGLWRSADSPYLALRGSWDTFFSGLDRKHRSNLRNRLKRLSALGHVELEVVSSGQRMTSALEEGLQIEAAAWKGKVGTAIRCHPELRRFYRELAETAAERGWLRLHFLTVNGRRIAFHFSLCYSNTIYLLKGGFDPAFAPYSPSNLLCYLVLRDAFGRGIAGYDFLGSDEAWKREWTNDARPHSWLFVLPDLVRTRILHFAKFHLMPALKRKSHNVLRSHQNARTSLAGPAA